MTGDRVRRDRRAEEIFEQALARPPAERAAFLDAALAGEPELRRELAELLELAEGDAGFRANSGPAPCRAGPEPYTRNCRS